MMLAWMIIMRGVKRDIRSKAWADVDVEAETSRFVNIRLSIANDPVYHIHILLHSKVRLYK